MRKNLYVTVYHYKSGLHEEDLRTLTKKFVEFGTADGTIAHYERADGSGGFIVQELDPDRATDGYELVLRYGPWLEFEMYPVMTMEDAFPVIERVYG